MSEVKVGAFVLGALGILVAGSLWLAGSSTLSGRRVPYRVALKSAGGIQTGDRVRIAGVPVGRIQNVLLRQTHEWPVVLEVSLRPAMRLHADGTARVSTSGLVGTSYLEIDPGSPTAPELPAGGEIRGGSSPGIEDALARIEEISDKAVQVLDQTSRLLAEVGSEAAPVLARMGQLLSDDNVEHVRSLLKTMDRTTAEALPRFTALLARLEELSDKLDSGSDELPQLAADVAGLTADLRAAIGPDGARLRGVLEAAEQTLGETGDTLAFVRDNRAELESTLRNLDEATANLKALSQQVKERPFSLVRVRGEQDRRPGQGVRPP